MKPAKFFIAFTFLLAFALQVSAQKEKIKQIKLSTQDKKDIVGKVFEDGFEKLWKSAGFNQCLTPVVDGKKVIFLMSEIDEKLLPNNFKEHHFMIMSYSQISEEVKKNNGECYFRLGNFQIANSKVRVNLSRIVDEIYRFPDSEKYTRYGSGEGHTYNFEKINNEWKITSSEKIIIST